MGKPAWNERARVVVEPLVAELARAGVTPTSITLVGLVLNIAAGVWIGRGHTVLGGVVLLVASLCDGLDGALARRLNRVTKFGAFLDSTIDRIAETAVLAGIAAHFFLSGGVAGGVWGVVTLVALGGSLITSYARARAEGLGMECKVGWFERPERIVVTVLGLLLGYRALFSAMAVLTVFSWFTVVQRIRHVQRLTANTPSAPPQGSDTTA